MFAEFGLFLLILSFFIAVFQMGVGFLPLWVGDEFHAIVRKVTIRAALLQAVVIVFSFAILVTVFAISDFSVRIVFEHSHTEKPLFYKIAGTWGNHEGSILLFSLTASVMGACLAIFGSKLENKFISVTLAVQAMVAVAMIGFTAFTSNPFDRLLDIPFEGNNLNPLLQDWALAVHPPILYLGYVGLSISFSFALAALMTGKIDNEWARWVRPWTLFAWANLTMGIALGSYWAYYELGWGGFWFWDPVENSSLMPWLAATALLHSAIVMEKRGALGSWTILLAIIAFGLSILGTFLVRSGILTSVHAFAVDPSRGVVLLGILTFFMVLAFALYAFRSKLIKQKAVFSPISREGALMLNNLLIAVMLATVFVGTFYPLFSEAIGGEKISVGAPFFNQTFNPLAIPLLLILPIGTMMQWKRTDIANVFSRLVWVFFATFILMMVSFYVTGYKGVMAWAGIMVGIWVVVGAIWELLSSAQFGQVKFSLAIKRLFKFPRAKFAVMMAHMGVGIMVLGIAAMSAWRVETVKDMNIGDTIEVAGFELEFKAVKNRSEGTYNEIVGEFEISLNNEVLGQISTSRRRYLMRSTPTTEVGLFNYNFGQIYIAFGQLSADTNKVQLRSYYNPLVLFIWLGPTLMTLAGFLSLSDRRNRKIKRKKKKELVDA